MTMLPIPAQGLTALQETPYEVLRDRSNLVKLDATIAANQNEIPIGSILTKNTSTNRFQLRKSTRLTVAGANLDKTIYVASALPWKVGDAITVTGESADVITAVDYVANTITVSAGLTNTRAIGVVAYDGTNGVNKAVAISVDVGVPTRSYEQQASVAVRGHFIASKIRNFDAEARTDLAGNYTEEFDLYSI